MPNVSIADKLKQDISNVRTYNDLDMGMFYNYQEIHASLPVFLAFKKAVGTVAKCTANWHPSGLYVTNNMCLRWQPLAGDAHIIFFRQFMDLKYGRYSSGQIWVQPSLLEVHASMYYGMQPLYSELKGFPLTGVGHNIDDAARMSAQLMLNFLTREEGKAWMRNHRMYEYYI